MNIVVTGSLGYVSKTLTEKLLKGGHSVTVVSSNAEKRKTIEAMGAKAAIGVMEDAGFLTDTFSGADAVYCMLAPYGNLADPENSVTAIIKRADVIATNYVQAITQSGVKRVVYLSSFGAEMSKENGIIIVHHNAETTLGNLPSDVDISFIRPAGFYKNLLAYVYAANNDGKITASYGEEDMVVWVADEDIADAIVEELETAAAGRSVRYVASDELSCNEAAGILGAAIGMPGLKWVKISDEQQLSDLKAHGLSDSIARSFTEINASIRDGKFYDDYNRHKPTPGKVKMKDFAKEFEAVYNQL